MSVVGGIMALIGAPALQVLSTCVDTLNLGNMSRRMEVERGPRIFDCDLHDPAITMPFNRWELFIIDWRREHGREPYYHWEQLEFVDALNIGIRTDVIRWGARVVRYTDAELLALPLATPLTADEMIIIDWRRRNRGELYYGPDQLRAPLVLRSDRSCDRG